MNVEASEIAKIFGVSVATVYNWVREGCPVVHKAARGRGSSVYDTIDVYKWLVGKAVTQAEAKGAPRKSGARMGGNAAPSGSASKEEAQRRKLTAEAELAELELAKKRGEVVELEDLEASLASEYAEVRSALRKVPERCVLQVMSTDNETGIKQAIRSEIDEALRLLAEGQDG